MLRCTNNVQNNAGNNINNEIRASQDDTETKK